MMETTLYSDDNNMANRSKLLKSNMTLDFNSSNSTKTKEVKMNGIGIGVLASPEFNILALGSPDLERMLVSTGGVITTPTTQVLFPNNVTEEQEAYAMGFVDALNALHQKSQQIAAPPSCNSNSNSQAVQLQPASNSHHYQHQWIPGVQGIICNSSGMDTMQPCLQPYVFTTTTALPGSLLPASLAPMSSCDNQLSSTGSSLLQQHSGLQSIPSGGGSMADGMRLPVLPTVVAPFAVSSLEQQRMSLQSQPTMMMSDSSFQSMMSSSSSPLSSSSLGSGVKEEPSASTIPLYHQQQLPPWSATTPPLSPINMDSQEGMKRDRKKARNRVAARKCRERKLERIAQLEAKVQSLKGDNAKLAQTASTLKEQVAVLKQQLILHVKSGCNVLLPQHCLS